MASIFQKQNGALYNFIFCLKHRRVDQLLNNCFNKHVRPNQLSVEKRCILTRMTNCEYQNYFFLSIQTSGDPDVESMNLWRGRKWTHANVKIFIEILQHFPLSDLNKMGIVDGEMVPPWLTWLNSLLPVPSDRHYASHNCRNKFCIFFNEIVLNFLLT